jgi:hypothetical protein
MKRCFYEEFAWSPWNLKTSEEFKGENSKDKFLISLIDFLRLENKDSFLKNKEIKIWKNSCN